jgi:hypothetical protein
MGWVAHSLSIAPGCISYASDCRLLISFLYPQMGDGGSLCKGTYVGRERPDELLSYDRLGYMQR